MSPENIEFKKTPLMCKVEASFCEGGQTFVDLLRQEYVERQKSAAVLGASWSASPATILSWVRKLNIPVHPTGLTKELWLTPEFKKRRIEGLKRSWQLDNEMKERRVTAIHTEKQRQGLKDSWNRLSTEERSARIRKSREGLNKICRQKRTVYLGGEPKEILSVLIGNGCFAQEIAKITGQTPAIIRHWLQEYNLYTRKTTSLDAEIIRKRCGLIQLAKEADLIQYLSPRDRLVLETRYGDNSKIVPLENIGDELKKTRERVRQIEVRALSIIEKMLLGELIPKNGIASLPRGQKNNHLAVKPPSD